MSDMQKASRDDGPVGYDSARHLLTGSLGSVHLTPMQGAILCQLLVHTGEPVHYKRLYAACWPDPDDEPGSGALNVIGTHMCHLRARLAEAGYPGKIKNIFDVGYLLVDDPRPMHVLHLVGSRHRLLRHLLETHPNRHAAGLLLPMFDA
jgi:DNA-binding response OmpR family regulator